ncbi:MAG TPA: riboflavin synthase [Kofleriaceae bacterium]|nr:riboflavin synthase [Kofleriaceae bacterium]
MFTGLVEDVGTIARVERQGGTCLIEVRPGALPVEELSVGDSVAVDGACLTVTARGGGVFAVTAVDETLRRTTLGEREPGHPVHLERALRLGDRLGGHMVQGHVDGVGELTARRAEGDNLELTIRAAPALLRYVVEKGSIAVDGVSLTVVRADDNSFAVALIPHTIAVTALGRKEVGGRVNLEVDMIAKYVERLLGGTSNGRVTT